ncbi:type VI secretion system-associated FHA domain protein TagH [Paraburkholderia sp. SIMBA_055]|jgi:FHA domain-containing protein
MSTAHNLILSVQGERAERLGGRREHVFDCRDGSIGRSEDCDWVLGTEGVSRLHALVRYLNGLYFVEDRSTNGMLLNGAALQRGDPAALKNGDRLQIDTFEITVRLSGATAGQDDTSRDVSRDVSTDARKAAVPAPLSPASAPPLPASHVGAARAQNAEPLDLGLLLPSARAGASGGAGFAEGLIPGAADAAAAGASLDPLALFDAPPSYSDEAAPAGPPAPDWNHMPAVADRFRPPQVELPRTSGPLLPDDWDATGSRVEPRSGPQREPVDVEPVAGTSADVAQATDSRQPADLRHASPAIVDSPASAPAPAPAAAPVSSIPTGAAAPSVDPAAAAPLTDSSPTPATSPSTSASATPPTPPTTPDPTPATTSASPPASADADADAEPQAQQLTDMLHIAVDAMMDVLRARAELKNRFRLPATLIQRSENNPLKFAPTAQEAVRRLFAPPDGGFLSGNAALNDAAADIRNHQMAMLAGVRSAFQSMLAQFDPARIEESEGRARRLPLGGRPRHWERYKEQFDALTRDPDECFRRLFGDEFARAYEQQLAHLKARSADDPQ